MNLQEPNGSAGSELVDWIDAEGQTIGVVTRREMRARRLPHRCVYILLFSSRGELFIHLRTATKDVHPSHWDVAVGGVLAAGESFDDGARRELQEELGVAAELTPLFPYRYADQNTVVFAMVYRAVHEGSFRCQPEEVVGGEFVSETEVEERIGRNRFCPDGVTVWRTYQSLTK